MTDIAAADCHHYHVRRPQRQPPWLWMFGTQLCKPVAFDFLGFGIPVAEGLHFTLRVYVFLWSTFCGSLSEVPVGGSVISPRSQEFKVSHQAPVSLVVSVHIVPQVFLGKWTERAASIHVLLLWSNYIFSGCNRQCRAVLQWNVLSTPLRFARHLSCNSVAALNWALYVFFKHR